MKRRALVQGTLTVVLALAVLPLVAHHMPQVLLQDESYVVLTGSMEPGIRPGDIVYNRRVAAEDLAVGDIITFRSEAGSERLYTHRIIAVSESFTGPVFRTKGDANEDPDPNPVPASLVLSTHTFTIPAYGRVMEVASTPLGLVLFLFVPGVALIAVQVRTIYRLLVQMERHRTLRQNPAGGARAAVLFQPVAREPARGGPGGGGRVR